MSDEGGETLISKLDFADPLYLHPSDISSTPLINIKLIGTENYRVWSCAMILALETKNKKEELYLGQIFSKVASEVWDELKETYNKVDGSIVFNLHHKINSLTQSGGPVSEYYHKLNSLWKQYDAMVELPNCSCDANKDFQKHSDLIKLMQFLMGLDDSYQPVRTNLLTQDPLPSVKYAFAVISREESHRSSSSFTANKIQTSSAFNVKTQTQSHNIGIISNNVSKFNNNRGPNPNLKCTKCNKLGHTIDRCFEIIGYPPSFNRRVSKNNNTITTSSTFPFTEEQVTKILSMINSKGNNDFKSNISVDHPNGTCVKISKIGDFVLSKHITLFDVLDVPGYAINLLSVYKVARDSKKFIGFDENNCYIQDLPKNGIMGRTLGIGRVQDGLYVLDDVCGNYAINNCSVTCYLSKFTWHNRMGHPAEPAMQVLGQLKFVFTRNEEEKKSPSYLQQLERKERMFERNYKYLCMCLNEGYK
ncbi:uncharacterized protein [Rutidosis leptorrhynchoides]|uniref:uncharacterized protein n=1 Tax=Rutidosis leptorrhynchoides TaxID=125765 RepID=UPI003A98CE9F